ncbi:Rieske domain-containing protein [Leucosporidium creatinivorum]|uniref:Choline monooxygenase, chloroplastic n=1 Tax=Leucosporidium creatinivorum TaxID=106004 RepID=A0A1Y2CG84_9BASI|nr:Rieske domain-containing protein [Leucosporidium creatinivorum]
MWRALKRAVWVVVSRRQPYRIRPPPFLPSALSLCSPLLYLLITRRMPSVSSFPTDDAAKLQGSTPVDAEPIYNLPASWYRSQEIYDLERRAIFSKSWLLTTHSSRFTEAGQFVRFQTAGYDFFLLRDREGELHAFHNTCRHRAFPIIGSKKEGESTPHTEAGKVAILACKYHGWSYTMKGALAKAPGFESVEGFDPAANGLWELRLHKDQFGFLWVNMDTSDDAITFEQQFPSSDPRLQNVDMSKYEFVKSWSMEDCQYNWKALIDNYSECYHCGPAHPGIKKTTDLTNYYVVTKDNIMSHYAVAKPGYKEGHRQGGDIIPVWHWPYSAITTTPNYMYSMRVVPTGPTTTSMQYDVYKHKDASQAVFEDTDAAFMQIEKEDKFLCTNAQKNLSAGTYNTGPLHPQREQGPIYFQQLIKKALSSHRELEKAAGKEIHPARRQTRGETAEDRFCAELEGACGGNKKLEW